jgi:hypothetical protein
MGAAAARAALLLVSGAAAVAAQQPNASPAATGLSGAYLARARGYDAVAWNPANLGMSGNPSFSLGLFAVTASSGLDPISLSDVAPYSGKDLPKTQREAWLQSVTTSGGENGRVDGGVTWLGLSAGQFAFQLASSVAGLSKVSPDAFEALMFGNVSRTGTIKNLSLQGSTVQVGGFSTGALSYGMSTGSKSAGGSHLSFGATAKYVVGHFLGMAQDAGSSTTADAVSVNFRIVYSNPDSTKAAGSGFGLDLGMAWSQDRMSFGATVQNVVNTFAWDETKLLSKPGTAIFTAATNSTNFDDKAYSAAPAGLRAQVTANKFKPVVAAGVAYEFTPSVTLSADGRQQTGDGILLGPKTQLGGGVEYRGIPMLRLRGGASYITDGYGVSGGVGLAFGKYELGIGAAMRSVNSGKEPVVTLNVVSIR